MAQRADKDAIVIDTSVSKRAIIDAADLPAMLKAILRDHAAKILNRSNSGENKGLCTTIRADGDRLVFETTLHSDPPMSGAELWQSGGLDPVAVFRLAMP